MVRIRNKEIFYMLFGIALLIVLMTIADTVAGDPALPKCPAHPIANVRCEK